MPVGRGGRLLAPLALLLGLGSASCAAALQEEAPGEPESLPSVEAKTEGMRHLEGFFDLHWDEGEGKLYWEIDRWEEEFLYQVSLATGLGSNPVGLDRGQLGGTHVLVARRVGPRVLLVEPNYGYRARSEDPAEVEAVRQAFAPSTHWGFEAVARTGDRLLVDATAFFLRDAHGIARTLERADQGSFELEESRSAVHLPRTKAFPRNTEVEVALTFVSGDPGPLVRRTAATGEAVTLRVHHSLVQLPGPGFEPRPVDPRVGAFGVAFHDYATPIDAELEVRWAARHRLEKRDPSAERSEPVEPIVYHLDPGVPEPIRSALLEGASWWNEAFEAAGYVDAFRVEMLPEDADPMDLRYNVIHWTHRRTRGWSYGSSVVDPRTGEILKGNVNLGSLRLRQDHLLGRGLAGPAATRGARAGGGGAIGDPGIPGGAAFGVCDLAEGPGFGYLAAVAREADPVEMALARVRQLSAHEVGHTLGLAHNFIASTYGRASVMDYPAPLVRITEAGGLDLSEAYDTGVGAYDRFAVRWLYADFPEGTDERAELEAIVREGLEDGMRFISDADARPPGAAHPLAHLWDNGADAVAALEHEVEVRRLGLESFGAASVAEGEPLASLEEVLVPLYLHHRYQVEAAVRSVGGVDYSYAVRGDGQRPLEVVPAHRQRAALEAALVTLEPSFLALPPRVLDLIPPRPFAAPERERFGGWTDPVLDPLAIAASAADHTVAFVLQGERMARLVTQHAREPELPGLEEVTGRLLDATWRGSREEDPYLAAVDEAVQRVVLDRLLAEAADPANGPAVRAVLAAELEGLAGWLGELEEPTAGQRLALEDIRRWQAREHGSEDPARPPDLPPGSPIGTPGEGG